MAATKYVSRMPARRFSQLPEFESSRISYDGGYQQYMVFVGAVVAIPETLRDAEAAPLLCAGVRHLTRCGTVERCLATSSRFRASAVLAILQFNSRTSWLQGGSYRARGRNRAAREEARSQCVHRYQIHKCSRKLCNSGGARSFWPPPQTQKLCPNSSTSGANGKLIVIGVSSDPIEVTPIQLITRTANIQGWASGTPAGEEDTLNFAELTACVP